VPTISHAEVQQPIETATLLEQQVEALPSGPVCWDIRLGSTAPGSASPATGYHVHGLVVGYVSDGIQHFVYEDGRTGTIEPGQAGLFEADAAHRHESVGAVPTAIVAFELSCEPQPNSIGNTGVLPIQGGSVPLQLQVRERVWQPGAQTPVHMLSGPTTTYILEGTIARSTASGGVTCHGPGESYVSPVGDLAQNTNIGDVPARTVDVDIWPAGEVRSVAQPPGVEVPSPYEACPAME
jgi:quercetin dioxygenase-like cupin family protein